MGGQPSRTRKLTVENDDPTNVIKVSDDVVQRIKNSQDSRPAATQQAVIQSPQQLPGHPTFIYEPSVTSVQLRQANLADLKNNDNYWENRLKNQQQQHQKINEILDTEYKRAVEEMDVSEKTKELAKALPPCQDAKNAVLKCYKENANQPMQCANLVEAFQRCVDSKRATIISSRG